MLLLHFTMKMISKEEKDYLLRIAYETIKSVLENGNFEIPKETPFENLKEKKGVFVTLTKRGKLRGCIGILKAIYPIYKGVARFAYEAAFKEPRFPPLEKEELNLLEVEISILDTPKKLNYENPEDLLRKLKQGQGVILKKGIYEATFLPEVWKQIPDKKEFLSHLSAKAFLGYDGWKEKPWPEIYTYNTISFKEKVSEIDKNG